MVINSPPTPVEDTSLIPAQRHERILQHLAVHKIASIAGLAKLLNVSKSTVRRDLEWLETQGYLEPTRGGAILSRHILSEIEYLQREQSHIEEKRAIGTATAALIEDGDVIFINSGTTTAQVLKQIKGKPNVVAITNNTAMMAESEEIDYDLVLLGGSYLPRSHAVVGLFTTDNVRQVYASKTIIGVDGISLKYGCTVPTRVEADVIRQMIERTSGPVIIVTDCSKWGAVSNFEIVRIDQIQTLVTDEGFDIQARVALAARSVEIIIAKTP